MFLWKKDRDKEEKKKERDKKKEKDKESKLTPDELKRLEEVRRSYGRTKKGHSDHSKSEDVSEKQSNSSEYSLSSAARSADSSPSGGSLSNVDHSKPGSPTKKPPPVPKKPPPRARLSPGSKLPTTPSPQPSNYSVSSLQESPQGLASEMIAFMEKMNQTPLTQSPTTPQTVTPGFNKPSAPPVPPSHLLPGEQGGHGVHWKTYALDLRLPSIIPLSPPEIRNLKIKRQPTGDFGFSLRRAAIPDRFSSEGENRQMIIFAEPSSVGKTNETGLLPGDRLLEVNGVVVENKSREEIIDLIKSSGDSVSLKVQPLPELRELTLRSTTAAQNTSSTLSPSGSYKFRAIAKSDEQLAAERAWLQNEKVWVIHRGGFCAAQLVKSGSLPPPPEGKVRVKLDYTGDHLEVDEEDVEKANSPHFNYVENISQLRHLNESSILHTLRQRFASGLIHTYAGNTMLMLNPLQPLTMYSEKIMRMFRSCRQDDMPPHIYAIAQSVYNSVLTSRRDQSIVLLGRSGSGKTTNLRHLLQYFTVIAGTSRNNITAEKINAISALLEAFGNSKTSLNTNATHFTELVSLDFDHSGQIVSTSVQVYMLERSRVCRRPEGEPNFHIFYQLLAGVDDHIRKELYLENLSEPNLFMTPLQKPEDQQRASLSWAYISAAMQTLSFKDSEVRAILCVIAAIYHLGVAGATKVGSGRSQFLKPQSAQKVAALLGTSVEDLAKCIFTSDYGSPVSGKVSPRSGSDCALEASESLQAMVFGLYSEVFNAVLSLINRSLSGGGRSTASVHILDCPGFQNPVSCDRQWGGTLEDLCHNYCQERLQMLFHESVFLAQQERYAQENIAWDSEEFQVSSPASLIDLIDHTPQQGPGRSSTNDLRDLGKRGLLWLLDEESLFPGSTEKSFLERLFTQYSGREYQQLVKKGPHNHQFTVQHFQGTNPVIYTVSGWLRASREHPVTRQASSLLLDSQKEYISQLYGSCRGLNHPSNVSGAHINAEGSSTLRRTSSIRRAQSVAAAGVKRRSLPLQVKYTMDGLMDMLRRTNLHFIHCLLPQHNAGLYDGKNALSALNKANATGDNLINIPLLRSQIRGAEILDAVRVHKQGFPENLMYSEFSRRFELLAPPEHRAPRPVIDERSAVETLLEHIDIDHSLYRLGLSQIFLRAGTLAHLESQRDFKLNDLVIRFQAHSRGYLARHFLKKRQVQDLAIRCIQRNVRKFLAIRSWSWWRLYVKVLPLLNVHRTEEELRVKTEELETLRSRAEKLEHERNELKQANDRLEAKVTELWADLNEEQTAATHTSEMLEGETSERMRLEKEVQELQTKCAQMQQKSERMEMEVMEARMYRNSELNGDLSDDEDINAGMIYQQKYERAVRELEMTKRRLQQQHEEELEQKMLSKKATDKKLAEITEDLEEERQLVSQWKRKSQKLGAELQDIRLLLEEQMGRNADLEKKQRKFDSELSAVQEEIRKERFIRERLQRDKDLVQAEKYSLEQELHTTRLDMEMQHEKISQLNKELDELTLSSRGEEEVTQLKRAKQELERKLRDQEEELEELAGQVQMLEQAKLRLEMSLEKQRQEHRREASVREEEVEEIRASAAKKVKNLEAQLEAEQEDRHQLVKQKHELERRIIELNDQPPPKDPEMERRLRRDLKRTKALLRDAQTMLEHTRDGQASKTLIRQLKNQLEDAEFAKTAALKARQGAEMELQDLQAQLEELSRTKSDAESRCLQMSREKSAIQTQLEEMEEEMTEVMRKYKAVVAQMSSDQKSLAEQNQQISELEAEKQVLKEQLVDVTSKMEHLAVQTEDTHRVHRLEAKVRDLESKLELEQTTHSRLEHQITRHKEQCERLREECDILRNKEHQGQEAVRRLQRQLRELREDYTAMQQKESEAYHRQHELEMALENAEADLQVTKNDLRLACQRIQDLQNALEENLDSDTDIPDESGSDSDSSLDMSSLLSRQQFTPLRRHDSMSSEASFELGARRSRASSFGQDASILSSRSEVETDITGLSSVEREKESTPSLTEQDHLELV